MPEDGGTILRTVVVALPVARGRIVIAKKASRIPRYVTLAGSNSSCWPLPFTAAQILWINLVTDGLEDVALAFEPVEPDLLRHPPRSRNEGVLRRCQRIADGQRSRIC